MLTRGTYWRIHSRLLRTRLEAYLLNEKEPVAKPAPVAPDREQAFAAITGVFRVVPQNPRLSVVSELQNGATSARCLHEHVQ